MKRYILNKHVYSPELTRLWFNGVEITLTEKQKHELCHIVDYKSLVHYARENIFTKCNEYKRFVRINRKKDNAQLTSGYFNETIDILNLIKNKQWRKENIDIHFMQKYI